VTDSGILTPSPDKITRQTPRIKTTGHMAKLSSAISGTVKEADGGGMERNRLDFDV